MLNQQELEYYAQLEREVGPGEAMKRLAEWERDRIDYSDNRVFDKAKRDYFRDQESLRPQRDWQYLQEMVADPYETAPWAKPQQEAFTRDAPPTEALAEQISSVFKNMGMPDRRAQDLTRKARELVDLTPLGWGPNTFYEAGAEGARGNYGSAALNAGFATMAPLAARVAPLTGVTTKGFRKLMGGGRERTANEQAVRSGLLDAYGNQQKLRNAQEAAGFSRFPRQEVGAALPQQQLRQGSPLGKLAAGTAAGGLAMLPEEAEAGGMKRKVIDVADRLLKTMGRGGSYVPMVRNRRSIQATKDLDHAASLDGYRWSPEELNAAKVLNDEMGYDKDLINNALQSIRGKR